MKVGILGSGTVGQSLARGFIKHGHSVTLGTRDTAKLADFGQESGAQIGSFADAAAFGEVVVLATFGMATEHALALAGPDAFAGKTVIDATNPLDFATGKPALAISGEDSLGERIQRALPQAHVVKAFNIVGAPSMVDPDFPGGPPTMFIAGDDAAAKARVTAILDEFGWETADLGDLTASRYLEAMCMVWVHYGMQAGTWQHAFKMLRA